LRLRPVLTSIGSLPPFPDSPEAAIRKSVELQRAHGLEILTDGEQRGDMLSMYESLPGIRPEGGVPRIVGRIRPLDDPAEFVKIRDLDFLRLTFPELSFKVSLTGPTTFAFSCASRGAGPTYRSAMDPALHEDLTEAIRPIAHEVHRRGADLQIDDPILSQGMRDYAPVVDRLDEIASEVPRVRASLHVCGGLRRGKVLEALLRLKNVSALNLAFAAPAERENVSLLERREWESRDIALGAGCARVQVSHVGEITTPEEVASLLRTISERIGADLLRYVVPDCGLRATSATFVSPILGNLHQGFLLAFPGS